MEAYQLQLKTIFDQEIPHTRDRSELWSTIHDSDRRWASQTVQLPDRKIIINLLKTGAIPPVIRHQAKSMLLSNTFYALQVKGAGNFTSLFTGNRQETSLIWKSIRERVVEPLVPFFSGITKVTSYRVSTKGLSFLRDLQALIQGSILGGRSTMIKSGITFMS